MNELRKIEGSTVATIEMTSACIAEEGDATLRIHHAEGKGRIHTSLPPFILSFHHQTRNAINVAMTSPLHIVSAITTEIGARSITMERDDAEGAVRIPSRKVPREGCLGRMSQRNDWSLSYLGMTALVGEIAHHLLKGVLCARGRIPVIGEGRSHPYHCHVQFLHLSLKLRILIDSLLRHILLREQYSLHLLASLWHPKVSHRSLACLVGDIASQIHRPLIHTTTSHTNGMSYRHKQALQQQNHTYNHHSHSLAKWEETTFHSSILLFHIHQYLYIHTNKRAKLQNKLAKTL